MGKYPEAERVTPVNAATAVGCIHCRGPIAIGKWDKLNGFLVECPHCHGHHGRAWNPRAIGFASLFLNAFSFFFTMRPIRAFFALILWSAAVFFLLPKTEYAPDWIQATAYIAVFLGPLIINMVLLVRHQMDLDRPAAAVRAA